MVPPDNAGTPEADLWPAGRTGNVTPGHEPGAGRGAHPQRPLERHYLRNEDVGKAGMSRGGALTRSQMELIAGRVSALNEC